MSEYGGILHSLLSRGPLSDIDVAIDILANAESELRGIINNSYECTEGGPVAEELYNKAVVANSEITHLIGIFKVFYDQWHDDRRMERNIPLLCLLAAVFSGDDAYRGEYNKICYVIKQSLPISVGTEKDVLKAPAPFKSEIFDD